jgi:hypothetical protein
VNILDDEAGRLMFEANRCRSLATTVTNEEAAQALRELAEFYVQQATKLLNTPDGERQD